MSFGDYVRDLARARGLQQSRTVLQELGESLVQDSAESFARAVLSKVEFQHGAVIDGIRHVEVLKAIENVVSPVLVLLVYVDTEEEVRTRRLIERGMSLGEIQMADRHSTERQVAGLLRASAVVEVRGDTDTGKVVDSIVERLKRSPKRV